MSTISSDFSAADSVLGYLYQIRLALLSALHRMAKGVPFCLYFESLDDVVFEQTGTPVELLQLKHHCKTAANLTDASPDLWKSLRVWIEGRSNQTIPADGQLFLITTSESGQGSAASYLQSENRDIDKAVSLLSQTATTSTNKKNEPGYKLFREMTGDEKTELLTSVIIVPKAPSIDETGKELTKGARLAVRREHVRSFLARLEGWWFQRALDQLITGVSSPILSAELESEYFDLQEQFKLDALPVDRDILSADVDEETFQGSVFVHQVKLTGIGSQRVLVAIRDYYRAFEQRSRWVREDLLLVGELDRYEQLLREEWELEFYRVADELGQTAAEEAKKAAAQSLYSWVEKSCFPIREKVQHPSLSRGSLHILADRLQVGWHPDFLSRLKHLLEPGGVS